MSFGTLYISNVYPRSAWYPQLAQYLGLDIEFESPEDVEDYGSLYKLKRSPLLITSDGFKLTETLAIMNYLVSKSDKPEFSADFIPAMFGRKLAVEEKERMQAADLTDKFLDYIEDYLNERKNKSKFLTSDEILVSDIFACQVLQHVDELSQFENLYAYFKSVKGEHPIFLQSGANVK